MADSTTSDAVVSEDSGNGHDRDDGAERLEIFDPESFARVTSDGLEVAGLYLYAKLDPLIDLACLVARDFFNRPHLYTELTDHDMPGRLARLGSRVGAEEYFPSAAQRRAMYEPVFGPCTPGAAETGDFTRLKDGLLAAASAFAEWSQATGIPMLRARVRTEHRPLREYLSGVTGATVTWARGSALRVIADEESYRVLRDPSVIAVFGLTRTPGEGWPFREDANGDKVVEEIGKALEPMPERRLSREKFSSLQRVALRGAEALASIMTFDESQGNDQLDELITRCYTWHAALKDWQAPVAIDSRNGRA